MPVTLNAILERVGKPVPSVSSEASLVALSELFTFGGFDTVAIVDAAHRRIAFVTARTIVHSVATMPSVANRWLSRSSNDDFLRCQAVDDASDALRAMFDGGHAMLLVEMDDGAIRSVSLERLAEVMLA